MNTDIKLYRSIFFLALATGLLLLIPLLAMQFTGEVTWTLSDFVIGGILIFGTGLLYIGITQKSTTLANRVAVGFALATGFLLIWVNLAVGIVGSEDNAVNLLYFGVIAVGLAGAFLSRFRQNTMALTMYAMAIAQVLVTAVALFGGFNPNPPGTVLHILSINGFFIMLFIISALLFRYAGSQQAGS